MGYSNWILMILHQILSALYNITTKAIAMDVTGYPDAKLFGPFMADAGGLELLQLHNNI